MTPASITQWLQEPDQLAEPAVLQGLLDRFPYFIPLQYMATATNQQTGDKLKLADYSALYQGNWLLFHQIISRAVNAGSVKKEIDDMQMVQKSGQLTQPAAETEIAATLPTEAEGISPTIDQVPEIETSMKMEEVSIIQPVFTEDYFLHQGIPVADGIPKELDIAQKDEALNELNPAPKDPKSLMVVMSFTDWLMHYKSKTEKEKEEEEDRKAVKHMWQREKLAAALEEEDDEIPENVFEMAVNSISKEDGLVSESLAEILAKQGKWDKAIEMYRKLSLRNPQKSTYFAQQIAAIQKKSE